MELHELVPSGDVLVSLDPEELGLKILKVLASYRPNDFLSPGMLERRALGEEPMSRFSNPYQGASRDEISTAIREAWAWLHGTALLIPHSDANPTYSRLSRKGRKLAADPDGSASRSRALPKEYLHPRIRDDVWTSFHRGKLDIAVFEAMKAVEVAVREVAGFGNDLIGVPLMTAAFREGGPLADP